VNDTTFRSCKNMRVPHHPLQKCSAMVVVHGRLFLVVNWRYLISVDVENNWKEHANLPNYADSPCGCVAWHDKIFLFGGGQVCVYEISTGTWHSRAPMLCICSGMSLVVFEDKIYSFGGWHAGKPMAFVDYYEPKYNFWVRTCNSELGAEYSAVVQE